MMGTGEASGEKRALSAAEAAISNPLIDDASMKGAKGLLISITGGAAAYLTLNYTIYKRTGSATWVAAALFLTFGTIGFVSPFAGALGDRFDRRRVMIASDLAGAA